MMMMEAENRAGGGGDGGEETCCSAPTCLLAHLLHRVSRYLSSVALSLPPSSLSHLHTSSLSLLLHRLLPSLPPYIVEQQELHVFCPLNSLLELDILRFLILISDKLRILLSIVADSYGDNSQKPFPSSSAIVREELRLLDSRDACRRASNDCFELLFPFLRERILSLPKETPNVEDADAKELGKRCAETVFEMQKYLDQVTLSLQKLNAQLSSTVKLISKTLAAYQKFPSFVTAALLRTSIRSFLDGTVESHENGKLVDVNSTPKCNGSAVASLYRHDCFFKKADKILDRLVDPQGPSMVVLGGRSGIGKTSLALQIACNERSAANFPGGVVHLSIGRDPDITALQALLLRKISGDSICHSACSKVAFGSPEEGNAALMSRLQELLPCLLVLDDVWDSAHVRPFMCLDGKDKGRILVISSDINTPAKWAEDADVHILEPLCDEEATGLFNSIACRSTSDRVPALSALVKNCAGVPRKIQAAASIFFHRKEEAFMLPSIKKLFKEDADAELDGHPATAIISLSADTRNGGENLECEDAANTNLLLSCFDVLAEVHPCIQECFLDLAALPKGDWVSLSTLLDIWSIGDGMEEERVLFVLALLASWSLLEWKVEENHGSVPGKEVSFYWRLAGEFYELARTLTVTSNGNFGDNENVYHSKGSRNHIDVLFMAMRSAVEAFDIFTESIFKLKASMYTNSLTCSVQKHNQTILDNMSAKITLHGFPNGGGLSSVISMFVKGSSLGKKDYRLFVLGQDSDQCAAWFTQHAITNKATKLSLVSGSMTKIPSDVKFSSLKVALLGSNRKLKSIPANMFTCMEQLVVLDLKQCSLLVTLPDSISSLMHLELLDLSGCSHLISLPHSVGNLKNLRFLRLSGCMSLTCLPTSLGILSSLQMLDLSMCVRLRCMPRAIGSLTSLQILDLAGCYSLQCLPDAVGSLRKLTTLILSGCSKLSYKPHWLEQIMIMAGLKTYEPMAVPKKIWKLGQLEVLHLCSLKNLSYLPQSIGKLQHLHHLNLSSCRSLDSLPDELGSLFLLERLDLSHTAIRKLPPSVGRMTSLVVLCLRGCSRMLCIPSSISALPKLEILEMAECWDFVILPDEFGNPHALPNLLELDLSGCSIRQLPSFADGAISKLQKLHLSGCQNLSSLPDTFGKLTSLVKIDLEGCRSLASLQGIGFSSLKQLQWLSIRNCIALTTLPVLDIKDLLSLKFFDASGCSGLSPFPEPLLQCAREHRFTLVRWGMLWH